VRHSKENKQRTLALLLPARLALQKYLEARPQVDLFNGGRGRATHCGVPAMDRHPSLSLPEYQHNKVQSALPSS
jgi:hypothetical protein